MKKILLTLLIALPFFGSAQINIHSDSSYSAIMFMTSGNDSGRIIIHGDTMKAIRGAIDNSILMAKQLNLANKVLRYVTVKGTVSPTNKKKFDAAVKEYLKNKQ